MNFSAVVDLTCDKNQFSASKFFDMNQPKRILVIDDEEDLLELVRYNLARDGYDVTCVASGEVGLVRAKEIAPDLIVLDLMLPGIDGLEFCKVAKSSDETRNIPIVMLTAKGEEADVVKGLELGADDYLTKPFSPKVLSARIKAVLRRRDLPQLNPMDTSEFSKKVAIAGIEIDPLRHEVKISNQLIDLTKTEFRLLQLLASHPGWVFTRAQIVDRVHGEDYPVTDRSVDVQVVGLRKKMGLSGALIETVRGIGYRFVDG